ncbi:MAG: hypothetical protein R2762_14945 [Bryobacteraceae bacterium]
MDVVLTSPDLGGIYRDNRRWAQQFVDHDPENRSLIEVNTAEDAVTATERAALAAGRTGKVIYAVGHGGGSDAEGEGGDQAGQADFAPRLRLRVTQFVVFYDVTTAWHGSSIADMETELSAAQAIRRSSRREAAIRTWYGQYFVDDPDAPAAERRALRRIAVRSVSGRATAQGFYDRIVAAFQANPVSRVVLLTCNVANAEAFVDEMASDFGVQVQAYRRKVISTTRAPIRMFLEGDAEGEGTNTARSTHEIPNSDIYVGRPMAAVRLPERRPTVPPVSEEE